MTDVGRAPENPTMHRPQQGHWARSRSEEASQPSTQLSTMFRESKADQAQALSHSISSGQEHAQLHVPTSSIPQGLQQSQAEASRKAAPAATAKISTNTSVSQKLVDFLSPLLKSPRKSSPRAADVATPPRTPPPQPGPAIPKSVSVPQFGSIAAAAGAPMTIYPALEQLYGAARSCKLPPSRTKPETGTPNYPTEMLALSNTLPPRMQRANWCLAEYVVVEKLYKGYASMVYKAICKRSADIVVLKVYTLAAVCDLYKYQIYREVRLHSSVQHENIITLYAAFQEGDKVVMVEEYADGADLFTVLHKYGGRLSERLAVQLVLEPFIRVLHYLHSKGMIHRDIKPENILFTKNMCLKLGDFGLAIDLREERAVTRAGTLDYMAPEVLRCPFKSHPNENKDNDALHYSTGVDSWAAGILTYELLVGVPPFYDPKRTGTQALIFTAVPAIPAGLSDEARDFISSALSKNPLKRLTIHGMLHHAWVDGYRNRRSMRQAPTASPTHRSPVAPGTPHGVTGQAIAAAAKSKAAANMTVVTAQLPVQTPQQLSPATPQKPAVAKPLLSPTAATAKPSATPTATGAVERLLMGSKNLQEYLQGQQLKVQQQKAAAAAQAQKKAAASPSLHPSQLSALSQANNGDGTVVVSSPSWRQAPSVKATVSPVKQAEPPAMQPQAFSMRAGL